MPADRLTNGRLTDSQLRVLKKKLHNGLAMFLNEEMVAELLELRQENERLKDQLARETAVVEAYRNLKN
jgi:hypothetical protein